MQFKKKRFKIGDLVKGCVSNAKMSKKYIVLSFHIDNVIVKNDKLKDILAF